MAEGKGSTSGDGLSLQTLVVAAVASAVAAVVVSHVWKGGTVIAAAMTPVIVSIVKELLAKPMESEIVKKPVQQVSKIASGRIVASATPRAERVRQAGKSFEDEPFTSGPLPPPTERQTRPHANGNGGPRPGVIESHPRRTYGATSSGRRNVRLKVAIVTGVLAFVIAALVLTVPELVFGGAVSSHHSTTLFGGGSSSSSKKKSSKGEKTSTDKNTPSQQSQSQPQNQQTTPTTPQATTPSATTPAPTTPQATPPPTTQAAPPSAGGTTTPSP